MCGISGILNTNKQNKSSFDAMLECINHRGPDDSGKFVSPGGDMFLGSKRLSILDLSARGRMPMYNKDKSVVVAQNGEIYNYMELRNELRGKGYRFKSTADTEVIVYGYEEWGVEVFNKLRGMFAIAIYDLKKGKAFLARDRVGIKPLYYLARNKELYFSSEVKSFSKIKGFNLTSEVDTEMVQILLGFMFLPESDSTIVKGVKKVKPGHYLSVNTSSGTFASKKYWELPVVKDSAPLKFEDAVEELDDLLLKTVESHLLSDVPLGVLLSGGLDSSLITAYVKKISKGEVKTFNAKFDHKFNESENAKAVASDLGTEHNEIFIDTSTVMRDIEKFAPDLDDLTTFDGGTLTTKILCKKLKDQGITVVLLGEGADEIFGGYSWFGLSQLPFSVLPDFMKSSMYYYAISRNVTFKPLFFYKYWYKKFKELYNNDVFRNISSVELQTQLPNHLLMKVDKGSMASSVEARVPFLDHKVVEFAHRLPREFKLKGSTFNFKSSNEKYILREVAKKYLSEEVVSRKKRGFFMPMFDVLKSDLDKVRGFVLSKDSLSAHLLPRKTIEGLFDFSGPEVIKMQKEYLLWRLFLLEVWRDANKN
jgi:asparagine synthase (glutamine-hydrolysing)